MSSGFDIVMGFIIAGFIGLMVVLFGLAVFHHYKSHKFNLLFREYLTYYKIGRIKELAKKRGFSIAEIMNSLEMKNVYLQDSALELDRKIEKDIVEELNKK